MICPELFVTPCPESPLNRSCPLRARPPSAAVVSVRLLALSRAAAMQASKRSNSLESEATRSAAWPGHLCVGAPDPHCRSHAILALRGATIKRVVKFWDARGPTHHVDAKR
jgi:hypothetical protein